RIIPIRLFVKKIRIFIFFAALGVAAMNGCQPSCDNLPTESLATVRIVNAITNAPQLLIYIDGKFFDSAVYDVNQNSFGYRTTYKSDGSQLRSGVHHVVALDNATHDSVVTWN